MTLWKKTSHLQDLILHWGVTTGSGNWSGGNWSSIGWGSGDEVVDHLGVKLLGGLLGWASGLGLSSTSSLSLSALASGSVTSWLGSGSRLWVWLWLGDAVSETLWCSDSWGLGSVDDNLNLDGN